MKPDPHFLILQPYHLSREKGKTLVVSLLAKRGVQRPPAGWESGTYTIHLKKSEVSMTFDELLLEVRQTGVLKIIQDRLDAADPVFGGTIGDLCTPNHQLMEPLRNNCYNSG